MTRPSVRVAGALWCIAALAVLALYWANPHSPANTALPLGLKLSMICGEIVLQTVVLLLAALIGSALGRRRSRPARATLFLLCLGLVGFPALSWGQAMQTSYFIGWGSIRMMLTNPVALVQHSLHFHFLATLVLPGLVVAAGAGLAVLTGRLASRRWGGGGLAALAGVAGVALAYLYSIPWSLVPFDLKSAYANPATGQVSTLGDYINELYLRKTGPLTTLLGEAVVERNGTLEADPSIPVVRRPLLSLEQYATGADRSALRPLNVILILVESLRTDELQVLGGRLEVMPRVEGVAETALVFGNHYTTASHSNYADLGPLSSHYPLRSHETHVYPRNPPYPRVLIYDLLKQFGYATAIISSQNENWGQMINYLSTEGLDDLLHSDNFDGDTYVPRNDIGFFSMAKRSGKVDDAATADRAIEWITRHGEQPYFIYLNFQNSHFPYEVGPGFARRFGGDELPFEPKFNHLERDQIRPMRARYRDSLGYVDAQIGRLIETLKARGEWEETMLIISGDTGQAFMEHGFSGHANRLYNEVLKTPLIVRIPGRPPERRTDLVHHLDVPPTILAALGLPPHPSFQGRSLLDARAPEREVFLVVQSPFSEQYAIVRDGWKLIHEPFSDRNLLYHLERDPGERVDLARTQPALAQRLRRRLDTWRYLQIEYYRQADQHLVHYPPVMSE